MSQRATAGMTRIGVQLDDGDRPRHAAHRRGRARHRHAPTYTARRPAARDAVRARAAQPASARAHHERSTSSKAQALPGVKAIVTHENCQVVWGAGSIAGGQQYNDDIKKITKQRRYAFNNPVRFVGEPVAAVAAVDRHVAEEALQLIAVDYEVLPFVLDHGRGAQARRAEDLARRQSLARTTATSRSRMAQKRGDVEDGVRAADHVFEDRYTTSFVPQRADGAARRAWRTGKATS